MQKLLRNNGVISEYMEAKLKVQAFRANDLTPNSGKQFELGRAWCTDFFEIDESISEIKYTLIFKPLSVSHVALANKEIELKLSDVTNRGDRKAYANGQYGMSQIKDFFINDLHLTEDNLEDYFAIYRTSIGKYYLYFIPQLLYTNFISFFKSAIPEVTIVREGIANSDSSTHPLQQIFYGAPGTGKSNTIKREVEDKSKTHFRTTFHPDSDYSTFVGCYKPSVKPTGVTLASGEKEEIVTYKFVPQAFTNAYVAAWLSDEEVYLIIEEINRGNCAQIFGDLFQLLDRKGGVSEYSIDADTDLGDYIKDKLKQSNRADIPEDVRSGKKLMLPANLYIWATMNTSDQSLFPIDSAFKRRWEWCYKPIMEHKDKAYKIKVGKAQYDWWAFLDAINSVIDTVTNSEDKKLGYFFAIPEDDKVITAGQLVGKVLFYLWNDVFKNYGFDDAIFKKPKKEGDRRDRFSFSDFFDGEGPNIENVQTFMSNLGLKDENQTSEQAETTPEDE